MKKKYFIILLFMCIQYQFLAQAQIITTIAGCDTFGFSGDGGPATKAKFTITELAIDDSNNLFISDPAKNVIRKVSRLGIISTFAGNDTAGFSGDNGPATAAKIFSPECIAFDKKGNTYFCDAGNKRIRKVDAAGIIYTFAGNGGAYVGDGIPATAAGLGQGEGLCNDVTGNIYIAASYRILKVDIATGLLTNYAGMGIPGCSGNGGPATAAVINCNTSQISMDAVGNMYLPQDSCIRKISVTGIITKIAGTSSYGYSGDEGPATAAQINGVNNAFPDQCGNLYIGDVYNNRIRKVDGHGIITTIAGNGYNAVAHGSTLTGGYSGDGGLATAAELFGPSVYLDKHSNIYIADCGNYCVRYIKMDSCKSVLEVAPPDSYREEERVSVYPNPNTGTFTINIQAVSNDAVHITLTNIMGIKVKEFNVTPNREQELSIDVPPGMYLLSAETGHNRYVSKFVINR